MFCGSPTSLQQALLTIKHTTRTPTGLQQSCHQDRLPKCLQASSTLCNSQNGLFEPLQASYTLSGWQNGLTNHLKDSNLQALLQFNWTPRTSHYGVRYIPQPQSLHARWPPAIRFATMRNSAFQFCILCVCLLCFDNQAPGTLYVFLFLLSLVSLYVSCALITTLLYLLHLKKAYIHSLSSLSCFIFTSYIYKYWSTHFPEICQIVCRLIGQGVTIYVI